MRDVVFTRLTYQDESARSEKGSYLTAVFLREKPLKCDFNTVKRVNSEIVYDRHSTYGGPCFSALYVKTLGNRRKFQHTLIDSSRPVYQI